MLSTSCYLRKQACTYLETIVQRASIEVQNKVVGVWENFLRDLADEDYQG